MPALGDSSVEKRSGIFDWQMLGLETSKIRNSLINKLEFGKKDVMMM